MGHHHHHGHSHSHSYSTIHKSYIIAIGLNAIFIVTEVVAGFWSNSLALISDAGHNFSDVLSLVLSLVAIKLAGIKPTEKFTYGFKKSTILAALFNAIILLFTMGAICWEAIRRLENPIPLHGNIIAIVAFIGIFINVLSALLFAKEKELNSRAAFLHLMADALVSLGVVIGGIIISYTSWNWVDPAISIGITIVILIGTWGILSDSLRLSLDAVPKTMNVGEIEAKLAGLVGVKEVHHTHVWSISTNEVAITTHLVVGEETTFQEVQKLRNEAKHLLQHLEISHATIEIEDDKKNCITEKC